MSSAITIAAIKGLEKAELRRMLNRIERAPRPEPTSNAMCYAPSNPPSATANYICPICGEKTVYGVPKDGRGDYGLVSLITDDLDTARWLVADTCKRFHGLKLVEVGFCRRCSPDVARPHLALHLAFSDGTTRDVRRVTLQDLHLLYTFFVSQLAVTGDCQADGYLLLDLPRLRKLLGITPRAAGAAGRP